MIGCKKEIHLSSENINKKIKIDTLELEDKNIVIFIKPSLKYLDSLKKTYKNEDDFYTIADDANFYTAEAGNYSIKNKIDTVNTFNDKIIKIGNSVISLSKYKPWTLLLYKKGEQVVNIFPVDMEKEFFSYYPDNKDESKTNNEILSKYNLSPSNILYKNKINFYANEEKNNVFILQNEDANKRTFLLIKNKKTVIKSENIIPCEECGNGAESFYDYKIENGILYFSSSYKSNENIYQMNFEFTKDQNSFFILNKVIINKSSIGESNENKIILNQKEFGQIKIENFNYSDFVSKYVL